VTRTKNAKVMGIFLSSAVACDILLMSGVAAAGCVEDVCLVDDVDDFDEVSVEVVKAAVDVGAAGMTAGGVDEGGGTDVDEAEVGAAGAVDDVDDIDDVVAAVGLLLIG
jgi:hypothetical protein